MTAPDGRQPVHVAALSVTGLAVCALCKVSLALAGAWDRLDGCHDCPGWVEPARARPGPAGLVELGVAQPGRLLGEAA